MKHRKKSSKIKYQHSMIKGLRRFLEKIEGWNEITTIIPGEIRPTNSGRKFTIELQYQTITGIKCLAKSDATVQEVFITTNNPDGLKKQLEKFLQKS